MNKLYPETKNITPFIREVSGLLKNVLMKLQTRFLERKSEPEGIDVEQRGDVDEIGGEI